MIALLQSKDVINTALQHKVATLEHQLDWFKRQLFGQKSERLPPLPDPTQMHLGEMDAAPTAPVAEPQRQVPAHTRRVAKRDLAGDGDTLPFFDESRVPVETIMVANPAAAGLTADQFEVIGEKASYRLAQRPGSFVVLKVAIGILPRATLVHPCTAYLRPVIKRRDTGVIHCPPAPVGVIEGSRADVSFCAGLLVDRFLLLQNLHFRHPWRS